MPEIIPFQSSFPWEILALVFEFSDDSTLAALGGVSLEILETVAPLMYRTVKVTSVEQLEKLFCRRDDEMKTPSRINHLLDSSQIHNLVLDFTTLTSPGPSSLKLFLSRKATATPVPLDSLRISIKADYAPFILILHRYLLPQLNPTHFECDFQDRPFARFLSFNLPKTPVLNGFTRLKTLDIKGLIPFQLNTIFLAALPLPSLNVRRVVRLHLGTLLYPECPDIASFIADIGRWGLILSLNLMQEGSVELVVRTEEERKVAEGALKSLKGRWTSQFRVEVEV